MLKSKLEFTKTRQNVVSLENRIKLLRRQEDFGKKATLKKVTMVRAIKAIRETSNFTKFQTGEAKQQRNEEDV